MVFLKTKYNIKRYNKCGNPAKQVATSHVTMQAQSL